MMQIRGNTQIMAGTILDAQISASAAIATSKLADGANFLKRDGTVAMTAAFNVGNNLVSNVATPVSTTDAANKAYVDSLVGNGISVKTACDYMSTANITLSGLGTQAGGDWSASLTAGMRILVAGQTDATTNGIYSASSTGWTRTTDFNSSSNIVPNSFVFVGKGTSYGDTGWVLTTDGAVTVGTTSLAFAQFSSAGVVVAGNGLTKTGNTLSVNVGNGVQLLSNNITLKLADSTLSLSASGLSLASLASGYILVGNASAVATGVAMTGDVTITNTGVTTVSASFMKSTNFIFNEAPTGSINGSNTTFTLANTPTSSTVSLYQNGIRLKPGAGNDYTLSGATITMITAPLTGDYLSADYMK